MMRVERMTISDERAIQAVAELEAGIFADPWSAREIENTLAQKHAYCAVLKNETEVVGYYLCYFVLDEWEIARIAVAPSIRRQGAGQLLFDHMMSVCKEKEITRLLLDVRESNETAISFYKKNGFAVDGIRKNFYGGVNPENAILMSKNTGEEFV